VLIADDADMRSSKRQRTTERSVDCSHLVAVIDDVLRSTRGMEFSASVAGACTSLCELSFLAHG